MSLTLKILNIFLQLSRYERLCCHCSCEQCILFDPGNVINFQFCLFLLSVLSCHDASVDIRGGDLGVGSFFHYGFFKCFDPLSPLTGPDTISRIFFFFDSWVAKSWYHILHEFPMHLVGLSIFIYLFTSFIFITCESHIHVTF